MFHLTTYVDTEEDSEEDLPFQDPPEDQIQKSKDRRRKGGHHTRRRSTPSNEQDASPDAELNSLYKSRVMKPEKDEAQITEMITKACAVCVPEEEEPPQKRGYLSKRSPWLYGLSQRLRYFVLEKYRLSWYLSEDDYESGCDPLGTLDFQLVQMEVQELWMEKERGCMCCAGQLMDVHEFRLQPKCSTRSFDLSTSEGVKDRTAWLFVLHETVAMSARAFKTWDPDPTIMPKKFWKLSLIAERHYFELANTGDILLFRSTSKVASAQRLITRGQYDHVAIIVRFSPEKVCILEAMGNTGVAMVDWTVFCTNGWHKLYKRMVVRRLDFKRDTTRMKNFFSWLRGAYGKKYQLSYKKLKQGMRGSQASLDDSENQGFFCSELVAKGLKVMDLLPEMRSAAQYWPSVFSEYNPSKTQTLEWTSELTSISLELDIIF